MALPEDVGPWPKEQMPDDSRLYMNVHKSHIDPNDGELMVGVFRDHDGGMSTDWNKYSTAEQTRGRAATPSNNGVIHLPVSGMRLIEGLSVEHDPVCKKFRAANGRWIQPNRAHTEVFGEKNEQRRLRLSRIFQWEIRL